MIHEMALKPWDCHYLQEDYVHIDIEDTHNIGCLADNVLVPLIQRSPNLRDITLTGYRGHAHELLQKLSYFCDESVETIDFDLESCGCQNYSFEFYRTDAFPNLRDFCLRGVISVLASMVLIDMSVVLSRSFRTLERVQIDLEACHSMWGVVRPLQLDVQYEQEQDSREGLPEGRSRYWLECERLKELVVRIGTPEPSESEPEEHPETIVTIRHLLSHKWECRGLETLRVPIKDSLEEDCQQCCGAASGDGNDGSGQDAVCRKHCQQFAREILKLLVQLRSLTRLQDLELRWYLCPTVQRLTMDELLDIISEAEAEGEVEGQYSGEAMVVAKKASHKDLEWLGLPLRKE